MKVDFITQENLDRVEKIASTSGKNDKISLAKSYRSDEEFVELVRAAYDPFKQYNIKKIKPLAIPVDVPDGVKKFLDEMARKDGAKNEDIARAGKIVQYLGNPELALLFVKVLKKDLKVGMNVRSWNEAGYDIPVFQLQLAHAQSHLEKFLKENPDEFILQTKFDGNRAVVFSKDGDDNMKMLSRNGHQINSCDFLLNQMLTCGIPSDTILDGEVLHESLNLQQCQSIVSLKDSSHDKGHTLTYQIFDIWKYRGQDVKHLSLKERMELIQELHTNEFIVAAPYDTWTPEKGDAKAYIEGVFQNVLAEGHEGLILKSPSSIYEGKRSRNWVKIKERDNLDLEVLEILEGEPGDRFEGMMGAVVCELNGKRFHVGTGWKESEREKYWNEPNLLLGKTIEIGYWKLSPDGVPLHPAKEKIREDK